jgi:hypothetical protein
MSNQFKSIFSWCLGGLIILVISCTSESSKNAFLQVSLTDAPGDYQEVNVDIQDVQVNADENANSGWKSLNVKKGVYNLLQFTNGLDTLLGSLELPAGKISQIRLVLGNNNTLKIDDQIYSLTTPSAQQSGLKILINTEMKAGITYKITLDFDAARSIVKTGSSKYILKPVIHSVVTTDVGAIKGVISPIAASPAVYAILGSDTIESTFADTLTGKFLLMGLAPGTYTVGFSPDTTYLSKSITGVNVSIGVVTDLGTVQISQ